MPPRRELDPHAPVVQNFSIEAEEYVLVAAITENDARLEILQEVQPAWFYRTMHRALFEAILDIFATGSNDCAEIDVVAVVERARELGKLAGVETDNRGEFIVEVMDIVGRVPLHFMYRPHMDTMRKCYKQREIASRAHRLKTLAAIDTNEARKEQNDIIAELDALRSDVLSSRWITPHDYLDTWELPQRRTKPPHQRMGFTECDRAFDLYAPGTVTYIAARPGQGKSSLIRQCLLSYARVEPVRLFSLEETPRTVYDKLICHVAHVNYNAYCYGQLTEVETANVVSAAGAIAELRLMVYEGQDVGIAHIKIVAKQHIATMGRTGCIIIDHLQLMQRSQKKSDNSAYAEITRGLKMLANETQLPILVCCALNRTAEHDKPNLGSLRDCGAIESDADNVMFIYTPDKEQPTDRLISFGKHRNGPLVQDPVLLMAWGEFRTRAQYVVPPGE
jgi:replicative DNA helicase